MDRSYLGLVAGLLAGKGVKIDNGLSEAEITYVEQKFSFVFPADLKQLLRTFLPKGEAFPDWRNPNLERIQSSLNWPFEGMCFDIEHDVFWMSEWGERPSELKDAFEVARIAVSKAPILIPIYSHRYMPSPPINEGNPVLSVYQTDIIYYGYDLTSYLSNEFRIPLPKNHIVREPRTVEFWSHI